jgi:hypothetical protein
MTVLDWGVGIFLALACWIFFLRGVLKAHRLHRANQHERERRELRRAAERGER